MFLFILYWNIIIHSMYNVRKKIMNKLQSFITTRAH
jgi:hypothetical protein